jgi:hypothetical protein
MYERFLLDNAYAKRTITKISWAELTDIKLDWQDQGMAARSDA